MGWTFYMNVKMFYGWSVPHVSVCHGRNSGAEWVCKLKDVLPVVSLTFSLFHFVRKVTYCVRMDRICECTGVPPVVNSTFSMLRKGGHLCLVGLPKQPLHVENVLQDVGQCRGWLLTTPRTAVTLNIFPTEVAIAPSLQLFQFQPFHHFFFLMRSFFPPTPLTITVFSTLKVFAYRKKNPLPSAIPISLHFLWWIVLSPCGSMVWVWLGVLLGWIM